MPKTCSDEDFIEAWNRLGGAEAVSAHFKLRIRGVYERRARIETKYGINLVARADMHGRPTVCLPTKGIRRIASVTGRVIVFSDAHFWPGKMTVANKALLTLAGELRPAMIVANGDIFDGARISRHDPIGWEQRPTLASELETCRERMEAIRQAAPKATHVWNIGNHDIRYARYLAMNAPALEQVKGTNLDDHITNWDMGWSLMLNDNTMIKHRYHNGIHATYNNTVKAGKSIVTGHLHRLQATSWADYNGHRWGVDSGCLLDIGPDCPQTFYAEDDPRPHSAGFVVLTFDKRGMLLEPEFCRVLNGEAYFRGAEV